MDADTQDALTRFYLRLLRDETWSYQLKKESLLPKEQSQEAYRKKLNKFVKLGFLSKSKRYYVDGKPRNPFKPNTNVISSLVMRYSLTRYEALAAMETFKSFSRCERWIANTTKMLECGQRLKFYETIFPLVFMGPQISRFFFRLLFISARRKQKETKRYSQLHGLLSAMLDDIELDIAHEGIDHIGKRLFLDVHVKELMMLVYAVGATQKHADTMRIATLEELTVPLLSPIRYPNTPIGKYEEFAGLSACKRYDAVMEHIRNVSDHFVKDYYGAGWEASLSAYLTYAIKSSLSDPKDEIRSLLAHIIKTYGVTKRHIEDVAIDIQSKIEGGKKSPGEL